MHFSVKNNFEIHANGINSREILLRIEDKLKSRQYNPEEIEFVKNLSFTPSSPVGMKGFDPIETTDLLERSVPEPDFKNPKYRYIRGPIRWIAGRFFNVFALINDKLEENRVQAVYNIIHELIALNHKQERLQKKLEALQAENLYFRRNLQALLAGNLPSGDESELDTDLIPGATAPQKAIMETLKSRNIEIFQGEFLVLDDFWGHVSSFIRSEFSFSASLSSPDSFTVAFARNSKKMRVKTGTVEEVLLSYPERSLDVIVHPDLANASGEMESFTDLVATRMKSGGYLILGLRAESISSPFRQSSRFLIEAKALNLALQEVGFHEEPGSKSSESENEVGPSCLIFRKL